MTERMPPQIRVHVLHLQRVFCQVSHASQLEPFAHTVAWMCAVHLPFVNAGVEVVGSCGNGNDLGNASAQQ